MSTTQNSGDIRTPQITVNAELDYLRNLVRDLQGECATLRQALTQTEKDRDAYLKTIYEEARAAREFEDVDIGTLHAISAGPVKPIE